MQADSKVAVVTGAASGIGLAVAEALASQCRGVCLVDRNPEPLHAATDRIRAAGHEAWAHELDVTRSDALAALFEAIRQEAGPVEVLVNSAGIPGHGDLTEVTDSLWSSVLDVNLNAVFYCMREALKQMLPRRRGIIVNISSICGITGCSSSPAYSAAKAGVIGLSKACARRYASQGIRINVIAPGLVATAFIEPDRRMGKLEKGIAKIPQGRMGTAEEIAGLTAYLCSDSASFITGQVISPNGGQLI
jgi:NAD(P)-dependent dehydrogenase (short-subunit alcohol dehydrogenase family)